MPAARALGGGLWRFGDQALIDNGLVNGSARTGGLVELGDALRAVGLPVSLCLRHDPRPGLAAAVADLAPMMFGRSFAVDLDLAAHRRRLRRARLGQPAEMRRKMVVAGGRAG